jgi:hypothetical protein
VAIRTRLYLDHVDAFLMEQPTLVEQRLRLADSLARVLGQLGLERRQKPPIDLTQYLSQRRPAEPAPQAAPTGGDHHVDDVRESDPHGHAGP